MLGRQGIISDIARTAGQARGLLAANAYDAMTLDLILPDQDGLSFIRDLRADARTRNLPVVVVSVLADEGRKAVRSGDAIGIVDWLVKPIDQKRLAAVIAGLGSVKRPGARLLYVEDEPDLVALLSALLGNDIQVVAAATLAEAKARLARERFDLVILDVGLPDGSGLDLLALLNRPGDGSVPVIILSADEIDPRAAANVNAAMVKSRSSNEQLVATIRSFLDKHPAVAE
jgi:DNA-binding response OmpR family regulator